MKNIFIVALCFTAFGHAAAQNDFGDLRLENAEKLYQGTQLLKPKDVLKIMEPNAEAHAIFKKAKRNYDAANVFATMAGALIGWPLGAALVGEDLQWGLAGGGIALILIAFPLTSAFKKNANIAIDLYNKDKSVRLYAPKMRVGLRGAGVGITLKL